MDALPHLPSPSQSSPPRRGLPLAKMFTYFVLLGVGVRILQEIFQEIAATSYFAELSRLSGLAASTLNTTKNLDDLLVTFFALSMTLLLILPVAWVHIITKGEETDSSLTQTLIVLSVIVAGVMLLLDDNLARSFGLVGVVSAVRYRNTLKDPKDAVYVFLALGVGMACGLQAYHVGLFVSVFECAILLLLWAYHTGAPTVGDAKLLLTLKDSEKKGTRTPAEALAWLTPEARQRLDADLEAQSRYIAMAGMFATRQGKKRPNAAIAVELPASATAARNRIGDLMNAHRGKWTLLGSEEKEGIATLEYLGRLPRRRTPPLKFLERLRQCDSEVRHVTFRSLRKMMAMRAAVEEPLDVTTKASTTGPMKSTPVPSDGQTGSLFHQSIEQHVSPRKSE